MPASTPRAGPRGRALAAVLAAAALAALLAGGIAWDMTAPVRVRDCPPNTFCFAPFPNGHRLHPLRAELLWALAACLLVLAVASIRRGRRAGSGSPERADGGDGEDGGR